MLFLFFSSVTKLITGGEATAKLASISGRTPVIMLVLDEMPLTSILGPGGQIDAARYPNFARLARESYWFRNTSTVDAFTEFAVPAILTGQRPQEGKLPDFADHPNNVFTLFGRTYRLRVQESLTQMCPRELCRQTSPGFVSRLQSLVSDLSVVDQHLLLPDDLRRHLPSISTSWQNFRGGPDLAKPSGPRTKLQFSEDLKNRAPSYNRPARVARFIADIRPQPAGARPLFDFLHVLLPHIPWQYMPSGDEFAQGEDVPGLSPVTDNWTGDQAAVTRGWQRHLVQVAYVDRIVGRVVRRLKQEGMWDRALFIVTADHGVSFRAGEPRRRLTRGNAPDILPVPLFIHAPNQRTGRQITKHIQTIDIVPTMAALLKIEIPWHVDGHSALGPNANRSEVSTTTSGKDRLTFPISAVDAMRREALRRQLSIFGWGSGGAGVYRIGPHPELIGRRVASLPRTGPGGASGAIQAAATYSNVSIGSGFAPARVIGTVSGGVRDLAIAVNGRIGAVTSVYQGGYSALVPESILHNGSNLVQVFSVSGGGRLALLAEAGAASAAGYALAGDVLRGPGKRVYKIVPGRLVGYLDGTIRNDQIVSASGWAADAKTFGPVDQVVAFAKGRLVFAGRPSGSRPDLGKLHHTDGRRLAFAFEVSTASLPPGKSPLKLFAIKGGIASPLSWYCHAGARQDVGC